MNQPCDRTLRGTTRELRQAARILKRAMTPAEERLWNSLRDRRLRGLKFRAQHPLGRFVLDFYCASARLVIEVDGSVHDQQTERDDARTSVLEAHGLHVVRFHNEEIVADLPSVLTRILEAATTRSSNP